MCLWVGLVMGCGRDSICAKRSCRITFTRGAALHHLHAGQAPHASQCPACAGQHAALAEAQQARDLRPHLDGEAVLRNIILLASNGPAVTSLSHPQLDNSCHCAAAKGGGTAGHSERKGVSTRFFGLVVNLLGFPYCILCIAFAVFLS